MSRQIDGALAVRINPSRNSGIVRHALDEVESIKSLLADVYRDDGDARTLIRELIQNADDAKADRIVFAVLDEGWPQADNSLLQGPALLVANNGPFTERDRDGFHRAIGGAKADDAGKIGRFGIGFKSVFHICEAVVYLGAEGGTLSPGVLNPWAGTGEEEFSDPLHPDWDTLEETDRENLEGVARHLLGQFEDGFIQWLPLRLKEHIDRAEDRPYGIGDVLPNPEQVEKWVRGSKSMTLLLAQCGFLRDIWVCRAKKPSNLQWHSGYTHINRVSSRPGGWVGRPQDDSVPSQRAFDGQIKNEESVWVVSGVEGLGHDGLRNLRKEPGWPTDTIPRDGRTVRIPRKALAHAAITVLRPTGNTDACTKLRLRWAVFLPLDDGDEPETSPLVETIGSSSANTCWEFILHGYFWPSQDRRSIPGVTEDGPATGESAIRKRWNQAVRDKMLLPMLPRVLADTVEDLPQDAAAALLRLVCESQIARAEAVTSKQVLLPIATTTGVRWEAREYRTQILSIPRWSHAPDIVRHDFLGGQVQIHGDMAFVDADAPRISGATSDWPIELFREFLACVPADALWSLETLSWVIEVIEHVCCSQTGPDQERSAVAAQWLASTIAEGALKATGEGPNEKKRAFREAWRDLTRILPKGWVVEAPVASQQAIVELAAAEAMGEGLVALSTGRGESNPSSALPDVTHVDRALETIGNNTRRAASTTQRGALARLLLAETLLACRGSTPLGEHLAQLPLLRALKQPGRRAEAWSVEELRRQQRCHRVFARPTESEENTPTPPGTVVDPVRAVEEAARAIGESVWIVDARVAVLAAVPLPTAEALAEAVLETVEIIGTPTDRGPLLLRLAMGDTSVTILAAMRVLLTGHADQAQIDIDLFYTRSDDSEGVRHADALRVLLRLLGRPWCHVHTELVESLSHGHVMTLHVRAVDAAALRKLLNECLQQERDWNALTDREATVVLGQLHGTMPDDQHPWRRMPLHRRVDGDRGPIDERTFLATESAHIPAELELEIKLLEPDRGVIQLYRDIPSLDEKGILRAMLVDGRPWKFADQIAQALQFDGATVVLPREQELLALLREKEWLPNNAGDAGFPPRVLLLVPEDLRVEIATLAAAGTFLGRRLIDEVANTTRPMASIVLYEMRCRPRLSAQVRHIVESMDRDAAIRIEGGAYALLPNLQQLDAILVEEVLQTPLRSGHRGWALLGTVSSLLQMNSSASTSISPEVLQLGRSLCGMVPSERQIEMLNSIATATPPRDSPGGRVYRKLFRFFVETTGFFHEVLPRLKLPTQDGQWRPACELARSESGVARSHLLVSELRQELRFEEVSAAPKDEEESTVENQWEGTAAALESYFKPWEERVPGGAVGSFLCLLGGGSGSQSEKLAHQWLGEDVSVDGMLLELPGAVEAIRGLRVFFSVHVASGARVEALNLLGNRVKMDVDAGSGSILSTDPDRLTNWHGDFWSQATGDVALGSSGHAQSGPPISFWSVNLRDVDPAQRPASELIALLGGAVEWWAVRVLEIERDLVQKWWGKWGRGSQAQIAPVYASILAHLPLTLGQLDVRECEELKRALGAANRAQRQREQAPVAHRSEAMNTERAALDALEVLIRQPEYQKLLWERVRARMRGFGYDASSVLLELAQNADDALAQSAEIAGRELTANVCKIVIRISEHGGRPTVDLLHYGRPVNDTGGTGFPDGRNRDWDQDLYYMMLLNLTGKTGETVGDSSKSSTTGRFGLGFKSVHLVTEEASVVSGFLAFRIVAGLLPIEETVPLDEELQSVDGHKATRIRLPLSNESAPAALIDRMFERFVWARTLLPVFARQVREVVVEGGKFAGVDAFHGGEIDGAPGWSIAKEPTAMLNLGMWRMLRFRPAYQQSGTLAIAIGFREGLPKAFPPEMPFLWNVTPTSESWGCGYAINGPFTLDPGRTHVAIEDEDTLLAVNLLGDALGRGLCELHDVIEETPERIMNYLPEGMGADGLIASLWWVLSTGFNTQDPKRQRLLLSLNGQGRGLSHWMCSRPVVPTGLSAPFSATLPALHEGTRIEVASSDLKDLSVCAALTEIDGMGRIARSHQVVSEDVAQRLRPLIEARMSRLDPIGLLTEAIEGWRHFMSPERFHSLRSIGADAVWQKIKPEGGRWSGKLQVNTAAGYPALARDMLLPADICREDVDADIEEELLRTAIAPDERVLGPGYVEAPGGVALFKDED